MRQIDAVLHEEAWILAWIVDDVLWGCWSDDESAWVQATSNCSGATVWWTCDAAEQYLEAHRPTMEHSRFVVNAKPPAVSDSDCAFCLEDRPGITHSAAATSLQTCLS